MLRFEQAEYRNAAGMLQEYCRNTTGMLQEYCRNAAGMLQEYCRNIGSILRYAAGMLQEYAIGMLQEYCLQEYCRHTLRECCGNVTGMLQEYCNMLLLCSTVRTFAAGQNFGATAPQTSGTTSTKKNTQQAEEPCKGLAQLQALIRRLLGGGVGTP